MSKLAKSKKNGRTMVAPNVGDLLSNQGIKKIGSDNQRPLLTTL
jgi:hypothetical protein